MYDVHVSLEQELRSNFFEEYRYNRYLLQKIKEAEDDPDVRLLSHEDIWAALGEKYYMRNCQEQ